MVYMGVGSTLHSDIFGFCRLGDLDLKNSRLVQVGAIKGLTLNPTGSLW